MSIPRHVKLVHFITIFHNDHTVKLEDRLLRHFLPDIQYTKAFIPVMKVR